MKIPGLTPGQTGPLDFEDTRNQGNRRRGGASAPPRTRLGVPPSKFSSAWYRHFENLVSRKIQSLRNPESIKYSVLFVVRLSLSTIPGLPVCLNAKYQSTPPPPHPLLFPTNPRPCHWCPHPRLRAAQYYLTRPRLALVSFCFTSFPTPRYLWLLIFGNNSSLDSPSEFGKRLWTTLLAREH